MSPSLKEYSQLLNLLLADNGGEDLGQPRAARAVDHLQAADLPHHLHQPHHLRPHELRVSPGEYFELRG